MFNSLKKNLSAILATLLLISLVPATALAFTWQNYITFTVSNNGTGNTNRTAIPILTGIRGQNLIDSALVNSSANNTQVKESSMDRTFGVDTENVTLFVDSILSGQSREYKLYTGYSPQQTRFPIITGYTNNNTAKGFVEVVDDDTNLEIGNNGTISTTGYLNLSPNVGTDLKFTRANSDWVSVPDHANLDFTNGAGTDLPGTGIAWVKLTDATSDGILIKWTVAGNQCNWIFDTDASDRLHFYLSNANGTINIARLSAAITTLENQWIHVAFTYDGLELVTGIKLFINGVRVDATSVTNGVYAGTVDTTAVLCLGAADAGGSAFLSGYMAEAKIYTAELSQSEIIADYRGGHRTTNLEAWWKLAEGTGLPQDSTANVHHATANTADWETGVWNPPHVSIIDKPGALRVYVSGTSNITASTTGGNSTTLDGLSSGNLTIQVNKNSALLGLGTISTVGTGLPIGDNLRFNAPMWSSLLNTSPFTTVDNYGWQGTVVGATWTSQGYSFDGNDEINISALVQGEMQSNFTIIA